MSIYALPGPLFELVSSGISTKPSKKDAQDACDSLKIVKPERQCSSELSMPQLTRADSSHNSSPRSSLGSLSDNSLDDSSSSITSIPRKRNVMIAVKEAKLDPERLIRSLSQATDSKKNPKVVSKPGGEISSAEDFPPCSLSVSQRRRRSRKHEEPDLSCRCGPHEDAIKFEMSVSFNGREYTATRSLPRLLQFRYDLIEEFRARRMWRERRRKRKESKVPQLAEVIDLSDDEDAEDSIPELPRLSEDASAKGGFTMLNALLRPYGPALERWLHRVIDIVPHDSQCLTQFLWEPLSGQATSKKYERRSSSVSNLDAIEETDDLEQYDSDTDDYLLIH